MNIKDLKVGDFVCIEEGLIHGEFYGNSVYLNCMKSGVQEISFLDGLYEYFSTTEAPGYHYTSEMVDWVETAQLNAELNSYFENDKSTWEPSLRERYYYITGFFKVRSGLWKGCIFDLERLKDNNCFKTIEDANNKLKKIKEILKGE